jgi:hypothetical protein
MPQKPSSRPLDQSTSALFERELGDIASLPDDVVRERLAELEHLVNMAQGAQAQLMCEMAARAAAADRAEVKARGRELLPHEERWQFVADEVAVTLSATKVAASHRFADALAAGAIPPVLEAWCTGAIDGRKARVICELVAEVSPDQQSVLAIGAVTYATDHTGPEVRRWLARRVISADPEAADRRRKQATAKRALSIQSMPDGMAELVALLPAVQARQVYDTANAIAHAADPDDARTMDQRRSDALVDLVVGRAEPPQVKVQVVVAADTLLGTNDEPGHVAGVGPVPASEVGALCGEGARASLSEVTFRRLLADPVNGRLLDLAEKQYRPSAALDRAVRARDHVCRFPGCSRPASSTRSGTDLDHTIPWPRGQTSASNLAVLCRHHHRLKHSPGWSAELGRDGVMRWTTPTGKTFITHAWEYLDPGRSDAA